MSTTIQIKRSSTASGVPLATDLAVGELAVNLADKRLFTKQSDGTVIELSTNPTDLDAATLRIDGVEITASAAELNSLDGFTGSTTELNILDGLTATTIELNTLDGITASTAELNKLDGYTGSTAELNILDGVTATTAELNYVDGVTSNIQTQLDSKANLSGANFTGNVDVAGDLSTDGLTVDGTDESVGITAGSFGVIGSNTTSGGTGTTSVVLGTFVDEGNEYFVSLNRGGVEKLRTTSTGIDVTGDVSTDTLTIDGTTVTATATELNTLDGITATTTELNYTDGVTSNIQTQLDGKATTAQGALADSAVQPDDNVSFGTGSFSGEISANGGIALGDNDKATFGAGDDLQIYHDGSNSFVKDTGTGNLYIDGANIAIRNSTGTSTGLYYNTGLDRTYLYSGNSVKLATTSTGVDVTGTITADGLTSNGDITVDTENAELKLIDTSSGNTTSILSNNFDTSISADGRLFLRSGGASNAIQIGATGNVSFYEDTGTTAKMVWDASAESLGINVTDPIYPLEVQGEAGIELFNGTGGGGVLNFRPSLGDANKYNMSISSYDHSGSGTSAADGLSINGFDGVSFATGSSTARQERMRIDSSGNVGIGTNSPSAKLDVNGLARIKNDNKLEWHNGFGSVSASVMGSGAGYLNLSTGGTERARIDSSGNLLVGYTSDYGIKGTGLFNGGVAVKTSKAVTETICTGASGTFSTITISFEGNNDNSTGIMDVQVAGYNDKGLDYCIMQYSTGAVVQMRSNASSGLSVSFTGTPNSTSGVWTMTISGSITHPVVTAKCTVGGLATAFASAPTITFA